MRTALYKTIAVVLVGVVAVQTLLVVAAHTHCRAVCGLKLHDHAHPHHQHEHHACDHAVSDDHDSETPQPGSPDSRDDCAACKFLGQFAVAAMPGAPAPCGDSPRQSVALRQTTEAASLSIAYFSRGPPVIC